MVEKKLEEMAWNDEALHRIHLQCAMYMLNRNKLEVAQHLYDQALLLQEDDHLALYQRSRCKRMIAQTRSAFKDAKAAMALADQSQPINLEVCDALFELNEFENCDVLLHTYARKFMRSAKVNAFFDREIVVEETLSNVLGDALLQFFMENETILEKSEADYHRRIHIDPRPQWKIFKEQDICDLTSIVGKTEDDITPCEQARRDLSFKLFLQIYLNKSWSDFMFLKDSLSNELILLPQLKYSCSFLKKMLDTQTKIIWSFLKMLHTRGPIYTKKNEKCPILKICERQNEAHLYRVQYETRRHMFTVLRKITKYRAEHNLKGLSKCVEDTICNFFLLKTRRVLCWKFVFINEVLNIFALAHLDAIRVPDDLEMVEEGERLRHFFGLPKEKQQEHKEMKFGDKSGFLDYRKFDEKMAAYRNRVAYLEKTKEFFKYPIARAYLDYTIGRIHKEQNRIDQCCRCAQRGLHEAILCQNYAWIFLMLMLAAKAYAKFSGIERLKETLLEAKNYVGYLKSERLENFIEEALLLNGNLLEEKKEKALSSLKSLDGTRKLDKRTTDSEGKKLRSKESKMSNID